MKGISQIVLAAAMLTMLTGCATTMMESYVGRDINDFILDKGPPTNIVELGDGKRAYQYIKHSSTPRSTYSNTQVYGFGNMAQAFTTTSGGGVSEKECVYTLIAKYYDMNNSWRIESFRKPSLLCEY